MPFFSKSTTENKGKIQLWQKIVLFIGAGAFLSTALIPLVGALRGGDQPSVPAQQQAAKPGEPPAPSPEELKKQEEGFLLTLKREPDNINALQGLTQVRLQMGDLEGGREGLLKLMEKEPNNPQVLQALVAVQTQLGDEAGLKKLEDQLSSTLAKEPENTLALQGLTQIRLGRGDLKGAIEPLDKLIALFPDEKVLKDLRKQIDDNMARDSGSGTPNNVSPTTPPQDAAPPKPETTP
jgi:cytochrome c-type biogenesis protein CcmH/NrfG